VERYFREEVPKIANAVSAKAFEIGTEKHQTLDATKRLVFLL